MMKGKTKEFCKRGFALFLAMTMLIGMSHTVFAEENVSNGTQESVPATEETTFEEDNLNIEVITTNSGSTSQTESNSSSENDDANIDSTGDIGAINVEVSGNESEFDITKTERPEETEGITSTPGSPEDLGWVESEKNEDSVVTEDSTNPDETTNSGNSDDQTSTNNPDDAADVDWEIFYDADKDVYKVTFKIPEDAKEPEQVIDLTKVLDRLGEYASTAEKPVEPVKDFTELGLSEEDQAKLYDYETEQKAWDEKDYPYVCAMVAKMNSQNWVDTHTMEEIVNEFNTNPYKGMYNIPTDMVATIPTKPDILENAEIFSKYQEYLGKYEDIYAEYQEALKEYDRRAEANVLEPGDVKKFELWLTSDSKHTYKYKSGSFTLATPSWENEPDNKNGVAGFDGQILPEEYIDHTEYHVTLRCEPIQDLLIAVGGIDAYDRFNGPHGEDSRIIKYLKDNYGGETVAESMNNYLLAYYCAKSGIEYASIDELVKNNADARAELSKTNTSGNKWFTLKGEEFIVDAHLETVKYDTFYKQLFSFAFGDEADIDEFLGEAKFNEGTNRWEYDNKSWTGNGYENALYYYMDHKEIWEETDVYFQTLLDEGLSAEQATWTSLMMALNIDGELTGNDWQDTKWPWYSSISLERMDIDFSLSKKDGAGATISSSETEFQIYYIENVKNEDGTETPVKMYCTYDEDTNTYTFVTTESTVKTKNGDLNISYAMMKDIVYYLQEITAPDGYERDTNVYILMSEDDYNQLSDEDKAALEGTFDKFLDMKKSDDGLSVSADFVNVRIVTPPAPTTPPGETPPPEDPPTDPEEPDEPTPQNEDPEDPVEEIPEDPVPLTNIPNDPVPLANVPLSVELAEIPDEDVPLAGLTDIFDEDVPLADVPETGDISVLWYVLIFASGVGLLVLRTADAKKRKNSLTR